MHISFILPDINGGGAQKMIINIANVYAEQGHKIDLVLFQNKGVYKNLIHKDINIVCFNNERSLYALNSLRRYFKDSKNIDAVISSMYYINVITIAANILSGSKQKIIATERNNFTLRIKSESRLHQIIFKNLVKYFYPKANHIVGISNGVCDDLKNVLGTNITPLITTIYNPVIPNYYKNKLRENISNIFPENTTLKLIASGRLVPQKDYSTMLKALLYYKKHFDDNFHLIILGEGNLKNEITTLIKNLELENHITFKGFVENPLPYMKQADIFLISSAWEGFGNVIVEALYCGLKIVSTNCLSGPAEILENGKYGTLTKVGNDVAFAQAIHEENIKDRIPEKQNKHALIFTAEKVAIEFKKVIESINV